jgi:hypothetical protein
MINPCLLQLFLFVAADNNDFSFVDADKLDTPNKQPWAIMRDDHR